MLESNMEKKINKKSIYQLYNLCKDEEVGSVTDVSIAHGEYADTFTELYRTILYIV